MTAQIRVGGRAAALLGKPGGRVSVPGGGEVAESRLPGRAQRSSRQLPRLG